MPSLVLKFSKFDKFNNAVFSARESDITESYERLTKYHNLLAAKVSTFLPIFSHPVHQYATIRFFKNRKFKRFSEGATYEINFKIALVNKNDKQYVNCHIESVKFVKAAPEIDMGEELDLDLQ